MSFFMWTAGIPFAMLAAAFALFVVTRPDNPLAVGLGAVAIVWLMFTARVRKIYWSSRIRSRAHYDGKRARSQATD